MCNNQSTFRLWRECLRGSDWTPRIQRRWMMILLSGYWSVLCTFLYIKEIAPRIMQSLRRCFNFKILNKYMVAFLSGPRIATNYQASATLERPYSISQACHLAWVRSSVFVLRGWEMSPPPPCTSVLSPMRS